MERNVRSCEEGQCLRGARAMRANVLTRAPKFNCCNRSGIGKVVGKRGKTRPTKKGQKPQLKRTSPGLSSQSVFWLEKANKNPKRIGMTSLGRHPEAQRQLNWRSSKRLDSHFLHTWWSSTSRCHATDAKALWSLTLLACLRLC